MRAVETLFAQLARLRSARAFHPRGEVFEASVRWDDSTSPTVRALGGAGSMEAMARLSKGIGTPGTLPDLLGIAVRLRPGDPVDVLFTTVGRSGWRRSVLSPATGWCRRPYSTLLPYLASGERVTLSLRPYQDRASPASVASAIGALAGGPLAFAVEEKRSGRWRVIGQLEITGNRPGHDIAFDPMLTALPDLTPVRPLSRIREHAYVGSRRGRGARAPRRRQH